MQSLDLKVKANGSKIDYFDLDELKQHPETLKLSQTPRTLDQFVNFIDTRIRGLPQSQPQYLTRGFLRSKQDDMLFVGQLSTDRQGLVLTPRFMIGSDRLQLYDFFERRKEVWK